MKNILITIIFLTTITGYSQQKTFRCFECDNNAKLKISVEYVDDNPISLKYKGQDSSIILKKIKGTIKSQKGYNNVSETYNEIVNGQSNGKYIFTHSGNYDYIKYIRKDGKKFDFTINLEESTNSSGDGYRTSACY